MHEYDDKYDTTGFDAFSFKDSKLHPISEISRYMGQCFKLVEVNAHLSTGAVVTANGVEYKAGTLPGEKLFHMGAGGSMNGVENDELYELKVDFAKDVLTTTPPGLVASETGDVKKNNAGDYPAGTYRAGAYAIEAVSTTCSGVAKYSLGGNGAATSGLLWEVTVFWHRK